MDDGDEDEWEYEYDENETEDFYITVDLSNIPEKADAQSSEGSVRPSLSGHPILLQSRLRAINAVRRHEETVAESSANDSSSSMGTMQITGLHTTNPLIMYGGQLLSCHWASTIGTDMFFVKPSPDAALTDIPLRSLPSVDLLAIGSAKLTANVARLRPRDEVIEKVSLNKEQFISHKDPTENDQPKPRVLVNNFLETLNRIKAERGETSRLVVSQSSEGVRLVAAKTRKSTDGEDVEMTGTEGQR
jgi:hypothetical protein